MGKSSHYYWPMYFADGTGQPLKTCETKPR